MRLSEFKAGVGVGAVRIGMAVADVQKLFGDATSHYPSPGEYDRDVDDEHFLCWKSKGLEVGFDVLDEHGQPTDKSRVVSIHVRGPEVTLDGGASVNAGAIVKLHGKPDESGEHGDEAKRRVWCYYKAGLQATYDKDGWLVSLCVSKPKAAPVVVKGR